jgi:GAF domain-containing protein
MSDYDPQVGRDMPPEPELTAAQSDSDEADVTVALHGLAGLVSDVDDLDDVLAQIAGFAVASVPGADGAGVTLVRAGDGPPAVPVVLGWAVTDPFVGEIDHLQYDICGEGPCLTAMQTGRALVSGSLGSDGRWPRFGGRVARLRVHSALSLPLIVRGVVVGALNMYARERDAFTERALRLGEQFAGPAAVSVRNIQRLHAVSTQATQLQVALKSRAVIDQAIGIMRSRSGAGEQEAFDRLRQISQSENVKIAVIAERLVEEAVRRARARQNQTGRQ